jgi:hypothetical protein
LLRYGFVRNIRLALILLACGVAYGQELAAPVEDLLSRLAKYHDAGKPQAQRVAFEFPEAVLNAYLASALKQRPRPGIESATLKILPGNRVSVDAVVDLDALDQRPKGMAEELKGAQPVAAELKFQVSNGAVKLTCDKFVLAGATLPPPVAAELIRILGAMQPEKFDTSRPVPLPFGLNRLSTTDGSISGDTGR